MKRVSINEAAKHLGCRPYTIRQGIRTGRFPAVMLGGRYLLNPEEMEACLREEATLNQQKARAACERQASNWT